MSPHFQISVEARHKLLRIALGGFFELADVARLEAEKAEAHAQLGAAPHSHVTLVDVRECHIQAQEVAAAFSAVITNPVSRARRLAFVAAGSLATMQVRRLLGQWPNARVFEDEASARVWLLEDEQDAA